jgi:hypothetical protein
VAVARQKHMHTRTQQPSHALPNGAYKSNECVCCMMRVQDARSDRDTRPKSVKHVMHKSVLCMCGPAVPLRGSIWLDDGAVRAVRDHHKSLFPVGVIKVVGEFSAQVKWAVAVAAQALFKCPNWQGMHGCACSYSLYTECRSCFSSVMLHGLLLRAESGVALRNQLQSAVDLFSALGHCCSVPEAHKPVRAARWSLAGQAHSKARCAAPMDPLCGTPGDSCVTPESHSRFLDTLHQ